MPTSGKRRTSAGSGQKKKKRQVEVEPCSIIYVSVPTAARAQEIAKKLLCDEKIACATLLPESTNYFMSKGCVKDFKEAILLCKTTKKRTCEAIECIAELHPYDMCEVFSMPMECGNESYFGFINYTVSGCGDPGAGGQDRDGGSCRTTTSTLKKPNKRDSGIRHARAGAETSEQPLQYRSRDEPRQSTRGATSSRNKDTRRHGGQNELRSPGSSIDLRQSPRQRRRSKRAIKPDDIKSNHHRPSETSWRRNRH